MPAWSWLLRADDPYLRAPVPLDRELPDPMGGAQGIVPKRCEHLRTAQPLSKSNQLRAKPHFEHGFDLGKPPVRSFSQHRRGGFVGEQFVPTGSAHQSRLRRSAPLAQTALEPAPVHHAVDE